LSTHGGRAAQQDRRQSRLSAGVRVLITDFETVVDDLDATVGGALAQHPELPVIMIGHSMGGMIAARYAQRHRDRLTALVSSPHQNAPLRSMFPRGPRSPDEPLDVSTLSRDDRVGEARRQIRWSGTGRSGGRCCGRSPACWA
jgi:pimeloyl-ACP methyl ester carboxylesterase